MQNRLFPNILRGITLSSLPPRQILRESPAKNNNNNTNCPQGKKETWRSQNPSLYQDFNLSGAFCAATLLWSFVFPFLSKLLHIWPILLKSGRFNDCNHQSLEQWLANLCCKGPEHRYFQLYQPSWQPEFCCCSKKAATGNRITVLEAKGCEMICVSVKLVRMG